MKSETTQNKINFPVSTGRFCFLTNVTNYLHHYGVDFTLHEVACMIGYWGFTFTNGSSEVVCGRNQGIMDLFLTFIDTFHLVNSPLPVHNESAFLACIDDALKADKIPFVSFDSHDLPHSPHFQTIHYPTAIIVVGIDQGAIQFFDNGLHELEQSVFFNSIAAIKPSVMHHLSKQATFNKTQLLKHGFLKIIQNFASCEPEKGLNGMQMLLTSFKQQPSSEAFYNLYHQLNRPGGLTISREMLHEFLCDLQKSHAFGVPNEILEIYNDLIAQWRFIANLSYKLSFKYSDKLHASVTKRIERAIELEEAGADALLKLGNALPLT